MRVFGAIPALRFPYNCRFLCSKSLIPPRRYNDTKGQLSFSVSSLHTAAASSSPAAGAAAVEPKPNPQPWLIVGLGNPGKMYNGTRHNVGFELVDAIAEAEGISMRSVSFKALFGKGFIGNVPVMLAKPQTFMNASGESVSKLIASIVSSIQFSILLTNRWSTFWQILKVGAIVSYYKIPVNQVLVIFDDLDLPFAKLRLLPKGGHGGHNGYIPCIGRPPGRMDPVNFVLRKFSKQEREEASEICDFPGKMNS
ncbi:hypothetical protein RJ639_025702 [Escallonia herrerae]|uniref:peptidyl-tRNA hydrolase n=1 Tax=Escallonia herrerae TaxID=1293975 RepID=A0AA89ABT9_9ASTE|nr:hypothetical protein RJ639_025702 [Escallonia herrerae]